MVSSDELTARMERVYDALDAVVETDLAKIPPSITSDEKRFTIYQDFRAGLSDARIQNLANSFIHNLANLQDHTRRWLRQNGLNQKQVDRFAAENPAVNILQDLSNNEKHGYPPREGGKSGKSPKLINVIRVMRLTTGTEPGSGIAYFVTPSGEQRTVGSGSAQVIITGDIVDSAGAKLGDLLKIETEALDAWEGFLRSVGALT